MVWDGIVQVQAGEQCDDGKNGDPDDGCRDDCTFTGEVVIAVAGGGSHTCVVTTDGQLGDGTGASRLTLVEVCSVL